MAKPLKADETRRLVEGYKIMGDNMSEIVRVCFAGYNYTILQRLYRHVKNHREEFQQYVQPDNRQVEFDRMVTHAQEYHAQHGHYQVSEQDDRYLSWWVDYQRHLHSKSKLPPDHYAKLASIQFDFETTSAE